MKRIAHKRIAAKIESWVCICEPRQWADGLTWYRKAHEYAKALSREYDIPLENVVGVIAVTSVGNRWERNLADAEALCKAHAYGIPFSKVKSATYKAQKAKAIRILDAEPEDVLRLIGTKHASKTRSFYSNILDPDTSIDVTIDRWIWRAVGMDGIHASPRLYHAVADIFRTIARKHNVRPCELQAAIWIAIRGSAI